MALMACRVFAIAVRSNHQRHDKPPISQNRSQARALNACNFASSTPAPLAQRLERSCCFVARTKLTCRMRGVGRVDSKLLANLLSPSPDGVCLATLTVPDKMTVRPSSVLPASASIWPDLYDLGVPKRRIRSISTGSRTGKIWSRRVSSIDCLEVAMLEP